MTIRRLLLVLALLAIPLVAAAQSWRVLNPHGRRRIIAGGANCQALRASRDTICVQNDGLSFQCNRTVCNPSEWDALTAGCSTRTPTPVATPTATGGTPGPVGTCPTGQTYFRATLDLSASPSDFAYLGARSTVSYAATTSCTEKFDNLSSFGDNYAIYVHRVFSTGGSNNWYVHQTLLRFKTGAQISGSATVQSANLLFRTTNVDQNDEYNFGTPVFLQGYYWVSPSSTFTCSDYRRDVPTNTVTDPPAFSIYNHTIATHAWNVVPLSTLGNIAKGSGSTTLRLWYNNFEPFAGNGVDICMMDTLSDCSDNGTTQQPYIEGCFTSAGGAPTPSPTPTPAPTSTSCTGSDVPFTLTMASSAGDDGYFTKHSTVSYADITSCSDTSIGTGTIYTQRGYNGSDWFIAVGALRFSSTGIIPAGKTVTSATLHVNVHGIVNADHRSVDWRYLTTLGSTAMSCSNIWSATVPGDTLAKTVTVDSLAVNPSGQTTSFVLQNPGTIPANGRITLRAFLTGGEPTGVNAVEFDAGLSSGTTPTITGCYTP